MARARTSAVIPSRFRKNGGHERHENFENRALDVLLVRNRTHLVCKTVGNVKPNNPNLLQSLVVVESYFDVDFCLWSYMLRTSRGDRERWRNNSFVGTIFVLLGKHEHVIFFFFACSDCPFAPPVRRRRSFDRRRCTSRRPHSPHPRCRHRRRHRHRPSQRLPF